MAKRRIRKVKRKVCKSKLIIMFMFFLIIGICFYAMLSSSSTSSESSHIKKDVKKEVVKKVPKEYQARLFMVGDALIHSALYQDAKQKDGSYDFKPMLDLIKPISSKYDLVYYNQETILGGESLGYSNYPRFNSPQEVGDAFVDAGFNIVSLATNHTMDKGEQGVINSVNYWKNQDVVSSGQWISQEDRDEIKVYEKNGISYAFFSYTTWTNGLETPVGKDYLNNVYSEEKARNDISKVRDKVDVVLVAMHWGNEYSLGVSKDQEKIANYLSSLGVDIIIGSHPHVVEPVEYINNGKTFVIYSLGNFISDQEGIERLTGLMMELTISKKVSVDKKVSITISSPKAELIYTKSYYRGRRNFKVYPYSQLNNDLLANYENYYEKYKKIVSSRYPELVWGITGE